MAKQKQTNTPLPQNIGAAAPQMARLTNNFRQRGCGWAIGGSSYMAAIGEDGSFPGLIWDFVLDPTYPIDEDFISLAAISMVTKLRPGSTDIYDVYDWIGAGAYPNPLDWLLEVQLLGFHQKVNEDLFQWLGPESLYFAVHERAGILDPTWQYQTRDQYPYATWDGHKWSDGYPMCVSPVDHPTFHKHYYRTGGAMDMGTCPALFFNDVIKGKVYNKGERLVKRSMPSFEYDGLEELPNTEHVPAIFFRLPIGKMAEFYVYGSEGGEDEQDALAELEKMDQELQRVKFIPWNQ